MVTEYNIYDAITTERGFLIKREFVSSGKVIGSIRQGTVCVCVWN